MKKTTPDNTTPSAAPAPDRVDQLFPLVDPQPLGEAVHLDLLDLTAVLTLIADTDMHRNGRCVEPALSLCVKVLELITDRMEASETAGRALDPNDC